MIDVRTYCEIITTIRVVNTCLTSHSYRLCMCVCVCVCWEHLKPTLLANFKYTIQYLNVDFMLYARSSELTFVWNLSLLTDRHLPISLPPETPSTTVLLFVSTGEARYFLEATHKWGHSSCAYLCLTHCRQPNVLQIHPRCHEQQHFLLFYGWIIPLRVLRCFFCI